MTTDGDARAADAVRRLRSEGAAALRFRWCDNANLVRAKAVHLPALLAAHPGASDEELARRLEGAVTMSQAQMAIPVTADEVVAEAGLAPVHDVALRPDWATLTPIPHTPGHWWVDVDIVDDGVAWPHCPRSFLRRTEAACRAEGLDPLVGAELEVVLLRPDAAGDLVAADTTSFALDAAFDLHAATIGEVLRSLDAQGVAVAQHHPESGPGQYELSLRPLPPLALADAVVSARQTLQAVARSAGLRATFLPVVPPGTSTSSMHLHLSLTGDPADGLGPTGPSFVAGLLDHLVPLLGATCPSTSSVRRFRPHAWVGAYTGWGVGNKEVPLRLVPAAGGGVRDCELKAVDGTANPYVAVGCALAAGLDGVRRQLQLPDPVAVDPADLTDAERASAGLTALPTEPGVALEAFAASPLFASAMGELHRSYVAVRRREHAVLGGLDLDAEVAILADRW